MGPTMKGLQPCTFYLMKQCHSLSGLSLALNFFLVIVVQGQIIKSPTDITANYQSAPVKINDLIHTKLDLKFDYRKCYVYGKAWITLKPHFYPTDTLRLDAKGMDLRNISVLKKGKQIPLKFIYDSLTVAVTLDKIYDQSENYTLYIEYTAKLDASKVRNEPHGLNFINPEEKETGVPTQIWTYGEPEYNSFWFPTIDKPNQKTTEEISLTVPGKFVTLSNGRLTFQEKHPDGTRTDTWKMDRPHAPYLFMIAVGDFTIVKDSWHGKEVSYYMEPRYAKNARAIFGDIPEAMTFFSKTLGVDYPWNKYAEIRVHGFNGGMENTTATVFNEDGQTSLRELADHGYDSGNVHELVHQWFGDYATAESWSNLPLNESMADLGEILWAEYKYGQDVADEHVYLGQQSYLKNANAWTEELIRFHYHHKQDMFDGVTYQKGGRILNMLRHYLGNGAFYKGLNIYLTRNAFKSVEAHKLRLAMEDASGQDLNWFFNQWFFGAGHPVLGITYNWDEQAKRQSVYLSQTQAGKPFVLPFSVDIYVAGKKQRYEVWMKHQKDTLTFSVPSKPDLVNVDGEKILLAVQTDQKTLSEYAFQFAHAPLYMDRCEAIDTAAAHTADTAAQKILIAGLKDKYYGLRIKAIQAIGKSTAALYLAGLPILTDLAIHDPSNLARAEAITQLGKRKTPANFEMFKQAVQSSNSYAVQSAALEAIWLQDPSSSISLAKPYENDSKGKLTQAILEIYIRSGGNAQWPYVYHCFTDPGSPYQYSFTRQFADFTGRINSAADAQEGIEAIADAVIQLKRLTATPRFINILNQVKGKRLKLNDQASAHTVDLTISRIKTAQKAL